MTNITCMRLWGERCTITILPDKDNNDNYHHYHHGYTTNTSGPIASGIGGVAMAIVV
jgi:hypothetical protein